MSRYRVEPTEREIEVLLALVEHTSEKAAAHALFLSINTVRNHAHHLYTAIGASGRAHAVALLWPALHDRYRLPGDERRLAERRAA